jgi:hypothetical protein
VLQLHSASPEQSTARAGAAAETAATVNTAKSDARTRPHKDLAAMTPSFDRLSVRNWLLLVMTSSGADVKAFSQRRGGEGT